MSKSEHEFIFKVTVIGDGGVGKTSLIRRYTEDNFQKDYIMTLGAQLSNYNYKINGDEIKLIFWDIAGQDTHHYLRPAFFQGSHAGIIVFSLEESDHGKKSFGNVNKWLNNFKQHCGEIPIVLFGNKADLVDEETLNNDKIFKFAEKHSFSGYYKTSAKTGTGVKQALQVIIEELYKKYSTPLV